MENLNPILEQLIVSRNGNYCHVIEVATAYEIECVIEQLYKEFEDVYTIEDIRDFFNTLDIIYYSGEDENEVHNFNVNEFINSLI